MILIFNNTIPIASGLHSKSLSLNFLTPLSENPGSAPEVHVSYVAMTHLDCSVGQVGQQVWPTSTLDPSLILA